MNYEELETELKERHCICGDIECAINLELARTSTEPASNMLDNLPPYEYNPTEEEKEETKQTLQAYADTPFNRLVMDDREGIGV